MAITFNNCLNIFTHSKQVLLEAQITKAYNLLLNEPYVQEFRNSQIKNQKRAAFKQENGIGVEGERTSSKALRLLQKQLSVVLKDAKI